MAARMPLLILLLALISTGDSLDINMSETMIRSGRTERKSGTDTTCPSSFKGLCHCGIQPYPHKESRKQYVVNCTNTRFTTTSMLLDLPYETEVLIFTGNMLNELDDNIFGSDVSPKLNFIDFSNNHITFIRGQTFHRVRNVETLILNFNNMEITDRFERPRIFSNFENLKFLHLTDAFTDKYNASAYYLLRLEDIFIESNLSKLERLHLEQNEIFSIGSNVEIFCPLKSLRQIYLSDNKMSDVEFQINCLKDLNYIDFRYNMITRLSERAMNRLNNFVSSGSPLRLNLKDNPLVCDCRSKQFLHWLKTSGVTMDTVEDYKCRDGYPKENIGQNIVDIKEVSCPDVVEVLGYSSNTIGVLSFFIIFLSIGLVLMGVYHKKKLSSFMYPLITNFSRKMSYKGLANEEAPTEVNV